MSRPILPNGAELPDNVGFDAVHILRNTSKSTYIHLVSSSGVKDSISCIRMNGRKNNTQFEDYEPFVSGSHFSAYDTRNFSKVSCPDCRQLVDPCLVQIHRQTDYLKKQQKLETNCELCGRHMLLTNLGRHMETHGPERYMCSLCGRKFHRSDYFQGHIKNPSACQVYLSELSLRIMSQQDQDEIDLENPMYDSFTSFTISSMALTLSRMQIPYHPSRPWKTF